jgi:3-oxoacyl-[acyl-carrier protein] reductase
MTKSLARTLGPAIRVNAVAPGFIEGEWLQKGLGEDYEKAKQNRAASSILNAVSTPEDIAAGILTMATASKTTGHTLVVDAGDTLGPRIVQGLK